MRLPAVSGMWPGWKTTSSSEAAQPAMSEAAQRAESQSHEPARARSHSTNSLSWQVLNLARRERRGPSSAPASQDRSAAAGIEVESPKTPRFHLRMPALPSTRLQLPHLTRSGTIGSGGRPSRPPTSGADQSRAASDEPPRLPPVQSEAMVSDVVPEPPRVVVSPAEEAGSRTSRASGDTLTNEPGEFRHGEAQARGALVGEVNEATNTEGDERPRRFMGCLPRIRSRRVKSQIVRCLVSGLFLIFLLAIYLALSITHSLDNSEFTVLLILIILFVTIFFCHGLIRLCMLVMRPQRDDDRSTHVPGIVSFAGFSLPRRPIRVLLARDEEAAGVESETTKLQPPAYGVWRESVRVDPNRLFWQRNQDPEVGEGERAPSPETQAAPRPPSYVSEDGVGYVVDAVPRSTAPTTETPLPVHPSERGRWNGQTAPW